MFEDEYRQMELNPIPLEYLLKDAFMLYPPTTAQLNGVEFIKRLPSGDIERARKVKRLCDKILIENQFSFFSSRFVYFFLFEHYH